MTRLPLARHLVVAAGILLVGLSLSFTHVNEVAADKPAAVVVTNTDANPVPVTGATTVSGTVAVSNTPNVTITNTDANPVPIMGATTVSGNVAVSNTPSVTVANTGENPVPVLESSNPGRQPWHWSLLLTPQSGDEPIPVPAGKRLVVEYGSAVLSAPSGEILFVDITGLNPSSPAGVRHTLSLGVSGSSSGFTLWTASQAMKLYLDQGTVSLRIGGVITGIPTGVVSLSGHLIDAQ